MVRHWIFRLYRYRQMTAIVKEKPSQSWNRNYNRIVGDAMTTSEYVLSLPNGFRAMGEIASKLVLADSYLYTGSVVFAVVVWEVTESKPIDETTPMQLFNMGNDTTFVPGGNGFESGYVWQPYGMEGYKSFDLSETDDFIYFEDGKIRFTDDYYCARVSRYPKKGRGRQWVFPGCLRANDVVRNGKGELTLRMNGSFMRYKFPAYHSAMRTIPWARVGYSANEDGTLDKREILEFGYYVRGVSDERMRRRHHALASKGWRFLESKWLDTVRLVMHVLRYNEIFATPRCTTQGVAALPIEHIRQAVRALKMWCNYCDLTQGAEYGPFTIESKLYSPSQNGSVGGAIGSEYEGTTITADRNSYIFFQKLKHEANSRVQAGIQQRTESARKVIEQYDYILTHTPPNKKDNGKLLTTAQKEAFRYLGSRWLDIQKDVLGALMLLFTWQRTVRVYWEANRQTYNGEKFVPIIPALRDGPFTKPMVDGTKAANRKIPLCSVFTLWPTPRCPAVDPDDDDDDDDDNTPEVPPVVPTDRKKVEDPPPPPPPPGWSFVGKDQPKEPPDYPKQGPGGGVKSPEPVEPNWFSWSWWTTPLPPEQVVPVVRKFVEISVAIETAGVSLGASTAIEGGAVLGEAGIVGVSRVAAQEVGVSYYINAAGHVIKTIGKQVIDLGPNRFIPAPRPF